MDTTVEQIGVVVVAELRAAGYMESTIDQYLKTIRVLSGFACERGGSYTPVLGAEFASLTTSPRTGKFSAQRRPPAHPHVAEAAIRTRVSYCRSRSRRR